MILNTYAILIGFLALLQIVASGVTLLVGAVAWRVSRRALAADEHTALEQRYYLAFLLTLLLVGINLVSWALFYLLLQSYVPEWSGVMCIYGVTQVGKGSMGPSRHLPALLQFLQVAKPALVFISGAWLTLFVINRRTATAPLQQRLFVLLIPLAALAAADAAAELAYIGIPKREEFPEAGCCTAVYEQPATPPLLGHGLWGDNEEIPLGSAYFAVNAALVLTLLGCARLMKVIPRNWVMAAMLLLGMSAAVISGLFLVDVAAPTLLKLPFHHCPYDLLPRVPEAVLAIVYFVAGSFFLGWAAVARWLARTPETEPLLPGTIRRLLDVSMWSYLLSLVMMTLELILV